MRENDIILDYTVTLVLFEEDVLGRRGQAPGMSMCGETALPGPCSGPAGQVMAVESCAADERQFKTLLKSVIIY